MYTDQILVELSGRRRPEIVYAKQGDVAARQVEVSFLDHGQPYTIPQGTTARIRVTKPDRTYIFNNCTISGNVVTAPLTAQTLAAAGEAAVDIALYQGEDELLSCSCFRLIISPRAGSDTAVESSDEFGALDELLQEAETSIPAATDAADAANTAANAANTAAGDANEAAGAANSAASAANSAASSANSAATAANSAASAANTAAENANEAAQQIFDESYILTAKTTFAESVEVTPTTYGNAIIEEINGATYQGPNPSPTNPQRIHGVGESGYFDGVWRPGAYSGINGEFGTDAESLCTANFIPVKPGDVIKIEVDADTDSEHVSFYDDDGTFISRSTMVSAGVTAPAESAWMLADITYNGNAPAVDAAPFMAITINGMYAIKVRAHGKNMAIPEFKWTVKNGTLSGVAYRIADDDGIILNGTATSNSAVRYNQPHPGEYYPAIWKLQAGKTYYVKDCQLFIKKSDGTSATTLSQYVAQEGDAIVGIQVYITEGVSYANQIFRPFICEGDADAPYIPYQGNTIYIPISAPLYDGDEIVCINGEFKVVRNNASITVDGSENWFEYSGGNIYGLSISNNPIKSTGNVLSYEFLGLPYNSQVTDMPDYSIKRNGNIYSSSFYIRTNGTDTLAQFKAFLASNPAKILYQVAVPIYESLPQEIMYSLISGDEITTAELLGENANLTLSNIIRFPRRPDGSIATSALAEAVEAKELAQQPKEPTYTPNMVMVTDGNGKPAASAVTETELGYLEGVTGSLAGLSNMILGIVDIYFPPSSFKNGAFSGQFTLPNDFKGTAVALVPVMWAEGNVIPPSTDQVSVIDSTFYQYDPQGKIQVELYYRSNDSWDVYIDFEPPGEYVINVGKIVRFIVLKKTSAYQITVT